jgi:hypothetical protein
VQRDFSELSKLPRITRHLLGAPWAPSFLLRARLGKEEFGQTNFDADVVPEPAGRLEIVKHVTCYGKILSERDLKLEMAPQEVISTDRHIGLRDLDRQSGNDKSAVCADLLASPRLLYANGGKKKRARILAQEGLDIVRRPLRQRRPKMTDNPMRPSDTGHVSQAARCGAKTWSGAPCKSAPVTGRRRCRMHGGADGSGAPKGPKNGNYKHGRYTAEVAATRRWLREATQMFRDLNKSP